MRKRGLMIFFFAGCFIKMTDGCHIRACQDLDMLIDTGSPAAVYSYRNHPQWPWGAEDIESFRTRFPGVELVLDNWTAALAAAQKIKSTLAFAGGRLGARVLRMHLPGLTPGFDDLRRRAELKLAVVSYPWGMTYLNGWPAPKVIVDTHDLSALERVQSGGYGRLRTGSLLKLKREIFYLGLADQVWSISYGEAWFLQALLGRDRVRTVPPAMRNWTGRVSAADASPDYDLVFVGSNNRWNAAAIGGFLAAHSKWGLPLKIAIAGSVCDNERVSAAADVTLLGFVDDLDTLYCRTRAVICPVEGTGTKIKVIEALRAGRPVFAAAGAMTGLLPGYHACVFPLDRESVARMLSSPELLAAAQESARAYSEFYRFDVVSAQVAKEISQCIGPIGSQDPVAVVARMEAARAEAETG